MRSVGLIFFLMMASLAALASDGLGEETSPRIFSKSMWTIVDGYCPIGCPRSVKEFIKSQMGRNVVLAEDKIEAPFLDACDGQVRVDVKKIALRQVLADINKGVAGRRRVTPKGLKVTAAEVLTAVAYCRRGELDLPMVRLPVVERDRVLVLFEQQSIIELR